MNTERDGILAILVEEIESLRQLLRINLIESLRQLLRINLPVLPKHLPSCDIKIIGEEAACNCGLQRVLRDE